MRAVSDHATAIVVATYSTLEGARSTVRSIHAAGLSCRVVDIDGSYVAVGSETVTLFAELAQRVDAVAQAKMAAATLEPDELTFYAGTTAVAAALAEEDRDVVLVATGVTVLGDVDRFAASAGGNLAVLPRHDRLGLGHNGLSRALVTHAVEFGPVKEPRPSSTLFTRSLVAFGRDARIDLLQQLASDWRYARGALDAHATTVGATVVRDDATLLSAWRGVDSPITRDTDGTLLVGATPVVAVDLSKLDPEKPWILEPVEQVRPSLLLSEHPVLFDVVRQVAEERLADTVGRDAELTVPPRELFDRVLRQEARRAHLMGGQIPDLLGIDGPAATAADVEEWALALVPAAHPRPVARYLAGVRALRRDVQEAYPHVPGNDSRKLGHWGVKYGPEARHVDPDLVRRAGEVTLAAQPSETTRRPGRRPEGVNLVGYLAAELGLGQSGRLVDAALHAAGVPTSTFDVSRRLPHRQSATYRVSEPHLYDTTLLCVNGAETGEVVKQVGDVVRGTRRVGMWYWELEDFPSNQAGGFRFVNEVWAATDFIRDAIAAKSPGVPVRTVVPPLPQREGDAPELPLRFGIDPTRPFFLFTFDFMSYAGRKNPYGLVEAFLKAFPERTPDGPQLVIKTINGEKKATDAERLRLQMSARDDLILIDEYLPNHERHVLVAHCTAYVSLHKAEGLGLTLAEAMAWGKPVIGTRYGGVVQFMNDENSFLVGWKPGSVPEDMGPYNKGLAWAEPDLDEAAALLRLVVEDPARAAAVGARAARDIRELHNVQVAGERMRQALEEGRTEWRAARRAARAERRAAEEAARPLARRVASRARRELRKARTRLSAARN